MTKRKLIAIIVIGAVVFTATVGGAVAYMIKTFQGQQSDFKPAQVSCTLDGAFVNDQKSELIVTNTSNIDAYIRVCNGICHGWQNGMDISRSNANTWTWTCMGNL